MSATRRADPLEQLVDRRLEERLSAGGEFFAAQADGIARCCHRMAERFARGGRLLAFGLSPAALSDVRHVAVEFVHPVIVGKRALPALGLSGDPGLIAEPDDIVMALGEPADGPSLAAGIAAARARGCLTVAFSKLGAEWELEPRSRDPFIRQEIVETTYHVLWELVHVFFEHRGLLEGRTAQRVHDVGASSFLYPFLGETEHDLDAILADVSQSVLMKAEEIAELRAKTVHSGSLPAAARALGDAFKAGGRVLALGNGGSATDAMDLVADFVSPPPGLPQRPAVDLTADTAIITAVANDIGSEAIFARQVIAYGRPGDVLVTFSTSGSSLSVLAGLVEARRRELMTIAFVGYDGGRIASEQLADHVITSPSQHIPRIQEAQATAYHLVVELGGAS